MPPTGGRRSEAMLRIVASEGNGESTLHLEGQVIGPWVGELGRVCDAMLATGARLVLDLTSVTFVGREGVRLLWRLRDQHVSVFNCSGFVAEQLKASTDRATRCP